jgi:predicted nucleotidyltransferase
MTYTLEQIRKRNLIIFEAKMGSHAYGTAMPTSDVDIRGIFIQPLEDVLEYGYTDQVADKTNDIVFYELKRFFELLDKNNPNILELLAAPEDCIIYKDPLYDIIQKHTSDFITKKCRYTFAGYAIEQIKKARGYNKKMNWETSEMTRKTVLDFCYILTDNGTIPFKEWLLKYRPLLTQKNFGIAAMDHAHDLYSMYINPSNGEWGIVSNEEKANDVQLTSIPKGIEIEAYLTFNKDAYSVHCKKYAEYLEWLNNRNEDRFKMNKEHGKNYDSKNMMHTFRLLKMALEIAKGELNVRRPEEEIKTLMKIRHGEYEFDILLSEAEGMIEELDSAFDNSSLPESVKKGLAGKIELQIRKLRYNL